MSTLLKILIALGVTLPLAAFVAGSLVAASEPSQPRERIIIQDDSTPTDPATADPRDEQDPARKPPAEDSEELSEDDQDDGADDGADTDLGSRPPRGGGDADDGGERDDDTRIGDDDTNDGGSDNTDDDSGEDDD